jgi:transcriptional regulator with XRE-family HTH domain
MAYPKVMRERAFEALRKGYTKTEVNEMLGLGINTIRSWEKLESETGSLEKRSLIRGAYKIDRGKLLDYYRENPLSTNQEAAVAFNCSVSGIRSAKKVLKITRKKRQFNI